MTWGVQPMRKSVFYSPTEVCHNSLLKRNKRTGWRGRTWTANLESEWPRKPAPSSTTVPCRNKLHKTKTMNGYWNKMLLKESHTPFIWYTTLKVGFLSMSFRLHRPMFCCTWDRLFDSCIRNMNGWTVNVKVGKLGINEHGNEPVTASTISISADLIIRKGRQFST